MNFEQKMLAWMVTVRNLRARQMSAGRRIDAGER